MTILFITLLFLTGAEADLVHETPFVSMAQCVAYAEDDLLSLVNQVNTVVPYDQQIEGYIYTCSDMTGEPV